MRALLMALLVAGGAALAFLLSRGGGASPVEAAGAPESLISTERVAAIAVNCANCHGTAGRLQTSIPSIAGKPETVLTAQLLAFRQDEIPGATVMPRLAKGYSEEELMAVARYFAAVALHED